MKSVSFCIGFLLMLTGSSVSVSADTISDILTISANDGPCVGNSIPMRTISETQENKNKNAQVFVRCFGRFPFGPKEGHANSDSIALAPVEAHLRSDGGDSGNDKREVDVITITATGESFPDGTSVSDELTVTITDTLGLYHFSKSLDILETDKSEKDAIPLPNDWRTFPGDMGDQISLSGQIGLLSVADNGSDSNFESGTETVTITAVSDTPEPSTIVLLSIGCAGIVGLTRRATLMM